VDGGSADGPWDTGGVPGDTVPWPSGVVPGDTSDDGADGTAIGPGELKYPVLTGGFTEGSTGTPEETTSSGSSGGPANRPAHRVSPVVITAKKARNTSVSVKIPFDVSL
jgi:hypothetical protein